MEEGKEGEHVIVALCRSLSRRSIREHEHIDKFGCANGYTHAFQASYSDDIKLGFCKILFIEFTETLERVVIVNVLDHKFASLSSEREVCLLKEQRHRPLQNQTRKSRLGSLYYDRYNKN